MRLLPELNEDAVRIYSFLLRLPDKASAELADATGLAVESVDQGLATLHHLRLATVDECGHWTAASPRAAAAELVEPVEIDVRARQALIEEQLDQTRRLRQALADLAPLYFESRRKRASESLELLEGSGAIRNALAAASEECTTEMLAIQPGSVHNPDTLRDTAPRDIAMLSRGVAMHFLYHHSARVNLALRSYVATVHPLGAEIRTAAEVHARLIIFDRRTAFLSTPTDQLLRTIPDLDAGVADSARALIVHDPTVVAHLTGMFDVEWHAAMPLMPDLESPDEKGYGPISREMERAVAELLAEGLKDEAVARRLGISVRSCRRHIAALTRDLDASSRFQAGVRAVRSGLI